MTKQRVIGLTGGIATGKSTVADYLGQTYQFPVLDADLFAREAVEPGSVILNRIVQRYGDSVLQMNGTLNRQGLGDIIFSNPQERVWLEKQIHPYVRTRFSSLLKALRTETVVCVIPLLFEVKMTNFVTEIWVVYCEAAQQLQRLMQRNSLTQEQAEARIQSQMPLAKKVAAADVVLDNSTTPEALLEQVDAAISRTSHRR